MRRRRIALKEFFHVLVQQRVMRQLVLEVSEFRRAGQLAVDSQVSDFEKTGFLGKLFNRVTPVAQDSRLTVDKGDLTQAGPGVSVTWIKADGSGLGAQFGEVNADLPLAPFHDREFVLLIL